MREGRFPRQTPKPIGHNRRKRAMSAIIEFVAPAELLFQPAQERESFREPGTKTDSVEFDSST